MESLVQTESRVQDFLKPGNRAYLIGIGGVGMSGLAKVLKHSGLQVAGSDLKDSREIQELRNLGISVYVGHDMAHVYQQDFIVYSSAISIKNAERREAIMRSIPLFHRAEVLSTLMNQGISIAITGTHGKTTTSAMVGFMLSRAGVRPTCVVGGRVTNFESNVLLGDPHLMVAEVDESDRSHLYFHPDYALITNLEEDHMDVYQNFDNLKAAFKEYISNLKTTGHLIYSAHDLYLRELTEQVANRVSYGLSKTFHYGAEEIVLDGFGSRYRLYEKGKPVSEVSISVPGRHNILNSLGAVAVLRTFGLPFDPILKALPEFRGVGRRLEVKLSLPKLTVIDDYAHHPTEIEASLLAIRALGKRTTVVFQPHRYSRTRYLATSFSEAFHHADRLILTDIYSAGEENPGSVDIKDLYRLIKSKHPNVSLIPKSQIIQHLCTDANPEGVVAFLGAGDITEVANEFAKRFSDSN